MPHPSNILSYAAPARPPRFPFSAVFAYIAPMLPTFWTTLLLDTMIRPSSFFPESLVFGSIGTTFIALIDGISFGITLFLRTRVFHAQLRSRPVLRSFLFSFPSLLLVILPAELLEPETFLSRLLLQLIFWGAPILSALLITTTKPLHTEPSSPLFTLSHQTPTRRSLAGAILSASAAYAFAIPLGFLFAAYLSTFFGKSDPWLTKGGLLGLVFQFPIALAAGTSCALALFFRVRSPRFPQASHAMLPAFLFGFLTTAAWSVLGEFSIFPEIDNIALALLVLFVAPCFAFPLLYALQLVPPATPKELLTP